MQDGSDWGDWRQHVLKSLEDVERVLEKVTDKQAEQSEILTRNTITVEQHHRRSTLLEQEIKRMETDMAEVREHVQQVQGAGKLIRWIGFTASAIMGVLGLLKLMGKL